MLNQGVTFYAFKVLIYTKISLKSVHLLSLATVQSIIAPYLVLEITSQVSTQEPPSLNCTYTPYKETKRQRIKRITFQFADNSSFY